MLAALAGKWIVGLTFLALTTILLIHTFFVAGAPYSGSAKTGPRKGRSAIITAATHTAAGLARTARGMARSARKVRLIEPQGRAARPLNAWISRWPLLGPITLATILERRGYDVAVYNENFSGPLDADGDAYADVCSADVVGISIMTPTANRGYALADRVRREAPDTTVVIGGVHATMCPHEAAEHADIVVCGEGETVIEDIAAGGITSGIIQAGRLENLDEIPPLNHFLVRDFDKLLASCRKRNLYELPVMTSRGCPHNCTYCSVTRMFGRKVRRQSVEKVHSDLQHYARQGFTTLFFYDDNFTTDRRWTVALLERLRPMRLRFNMQCRVDFHWIDAARRRRDDQLLRRMQAAGGSTMYIGYETLDERTARKWHKGYQGGQTLPQRLREDTRILHDHGFWIHGMFVLGPQHTAPVARNIVNFARGVEMESLQISILTPLPGTPMMDELRDHLVFNRFPADWDYYDGTHCVYDHSRLGIEGFQRAVFNAHRDFYIRGVWNARALRWVAARRISVLDKVRELWAGTRSAGQIMRKWRAETREFLKEVRVRTAAR